MESLFDLGILHHSITLRPCRFKQATPRLFTETTPTASRAGSISKRRVKITIADAGARDEIYKLRHDVFADELRQHQPNVAGELRDKLDGSNTYIVASVDDHIAGFISITPPGDAGYSIDKYITRDQLPFAVDHCLYEARLLTVVKSFRGSELAALLMYAVLRWVEAHGGTRVVAIGRRGVLPLYLKVGLQLVGLSVRSGEVDYEVIHATVAGLREAIPRFARMLR